MRSISCPISEETIEAWLAAAPGDPLRGWTGAELDVAARADPERAGFDIRTSWTSPSGIDASYARVRR